LVALPGKHGAQASLVRALILVLSHAEIDGSDVQRVQMGALVLTLLPRVTTDTDALVALSLLLQYATPEWKSTAATELMKAVLHQPISQSTLTLPSLLRVAGTPALACEILDAGLLSRLAAGLVSLPQGRRYSAAGVPSAEHKAWTTSLAIAATALREARLNGQLKHSVILQAVEFVQRLHQRLEVAVEGDRSALGLREQHVALRLLDEVSHVAGNAVGQFGALRLIRRGLEAVTKVLLNGESVQRLVAPVSAEEHELAMSLPSGEPVPRLGRPTTLGSPLSGPPCGTAFSMSVSSILQGSLCTAIGVIGLPELRSSQALAAVGEELLAASLRAALRSMHMVSCNAATCSSARAPLLAAAQSCLGIFAAFALQVATQQLDELRRSAEIAVVSRTPGSSSQITTIRNRLSEHANELRRLPAALQVWTEAALDEEGIVGVAVRREVLSPVSAAAAIVARDLAAVELLLDRMQ